MLIQGDKSDQIRSKVDIRAHWSSKLKLVIASMNLSAPWLIALRWPDWVFNLSKRVFNTFCVKLPMSNSVLCQSMTFTSSPLQNITKWLYTCNSKAGIDGTGWWNIDKTPGYHRDIFRPPTFLKSFLEGWKFFGRKTRVNFLTFQNLEFLILRNLNLGGKKHLKKLCDLIRILQQKCHIYRYWIKWLFSKNPFFQKKIA